MTRRQYLLLLAKLGFSVALVWLVLRKVEFASIVARIHAVDVRWLAPALMIGPLAVVLSGWRWQRLSLGLLRLGEAVRYTWIGLFFGSILPGVVGGDVAKGISLAAKVDRARDSRLPVSIIVDKLVGFWVLLALFDLVALWLMATQPALFATLRNALWVTLGVTGAGLLGGIVACHPQGALWLERAVARVPLAFLRAPARRILAALASYQGRAELLTRAAMMSAALHGLNALAFWLVMHALAIPATPLFAGVFYALLSVLLALPVSISGVGVRDVFAAGIFTAFGLNPESGVAFSWLLLAVSLPNILIGAAFQVVELFSRRTTR